jgi:hypothetical protein
MKTVGLDDTVAIHDDTLARAVDGEMVLVSLASGRYFGLDEIGTLLWEGVEAGRSLRDVHADIVAAFEVDAATAERDLLHLVGELIEARLLTTPT